MKSPDESNPSEPSASRPRISRWHFGAALAALAASLGILFAMAGTASLLGRAPSPGPGIDAPGLPFASAALLLILGLLLLWTGIRAWRICRRGLRAARHPGSAAFHGKKHE
ncbi:hypothetical protein [Azotobacter salinestris]|uniref:hypothetical protein n=1 Tax=Azotobacter salinestris TaxID=69964 RepID=UPI0032DECE41